jgi:hypothetical protein
MIWAEPSLLLGLHDSDVYGRKAVEFVVFGIDTAFREGDFVNIHGSESGTSTLC